MIFHTVREQSKRTKPMNDIQSVRNKFKHFTTVDLFYFSSSYRLLAYHMGSEANKFKSHINMCETWDTLRVWDDGDMRPAGDDDDDSVSRHDTPTDLQFSHSFLKDFRVIV